MRVFWVPFIYRFDCVYLNKYGIEWILKDTIIMHFIQGNNTTDIILMLCIVFILIFCSWSVLIWCYQKTHEKLISKWSCLLKKSVQFNCHFDLNKRSMMVVGFTNTRAIGANHHQSCEFEPRSWRGVLDATLCDTVRQWLATGWWFSLGTPVSSTIKPFFTI